MSLKFYSSPRKKREYPEARLQKVIVAHLRMADTLFFAIPNEGKRSIVMGAHLKQMGMLPGIADLAVIVDGKIHFMEVKAEGGRMSEAQLAFGFYCHAKGIPYEHVDNLPDALKTLSLWGAIKPTRVAA